MKQKGSGRFKEDKRRHAHPDLLSLLLLTTLALAEPIVGRASVIDGDTVDVRGTRIRVHGIDAPESGSIALNGTTIAEQIGSQIFI